MSARNIFVTFDIDGTLLTFKGPEGNRAHKRAIDYAIRSVWGVDGHVDEVSHAGSTDPLIIRAVLERHGVPDARIDAGMPAALSTACAAISGTLPDLRASVLPGVRALLCALGEAGVLLGLATGNLEAIAWAKLDAAGLRPYFSTGGFAGPAVRRPAVLRAALAAARRLDGGARFSPRRAGPPATGPWANVFHVGDAPSDMAAAAAAGFRGIGTLTGVGTRAQLEREKPFAVLDDLEDTAGFLRLIGIEDGD